MFYDDQQSEITSFVDRCRLRSNVLFSLCRESREFHDTLSFGRLGQVLSGGGKLSLFAIVSYYKQRLLAPVHQYFSDLLRTIPYPVKAS